LRRISKRRRSSSPSPPSGAAAPQPETGAAVIAGGEASWITASDLSLHELFEQQARDMLERADIDEEHKESILVAMACPCCGAGGMSFSVKLKAEERGRE
jgi:hypothetical protein